MKPRRGEIYYVDFDPVIGSEQGGRRPAVIIQNDLSNAASPVVIIAAITGKPASKLRPTNVELSPDQTGLDRASTVMLNQIRTVDKARLGRFVGKVPSETMRTIDAALKISLSLLDDSQEAAS